MKSYVRLSPLVVLVVLAFLITGCAQVQPPAPPAPVVIEPPPPAVVDDDPASDLENEAFQDISRFHELDEDKLLNELAQLESSSQTSPYVDLRHLVLLWLLGKPENTPRIDALINQLMHHPDARISATVSVLNRAIAIQRRHHERLAQLESKMESKLAEAQRRNEQLSAKIQALKALEKDLLSRPDPKPEATATVPSSR